MRVDKDARGQYQKIMERFGAVEQRFDHIDAEKTDQIFEIVKYTQEAQFRANRELKTVSEANERKIEELAQICSKEETVQLLRQMKEEG